MRTGLIAALAAILCVSAGQADEPALAGGPAETLSSREISRWLHRIQKPQRPGDVSTSSYRGTDTCRWANDGECDDPGIGTGACDQGTDYSDCWRIADGVEDDSCQWANDGECDEPGFGTGACTQATDLSDCGAIINLRFRNDSCDTAFDGVCNEPGTGDGRCDARTDRADCYGRERPLTINDHYFGRDDRVFMDTTATPWNVVGQIDLDSGGACTATLIADDVLITASHCINEDGVTDASAVFRTAYGRRGGPLEARVTGYLIDPRWDEERFSNGNDLDGTDWALLRIDRPLGAELGHVGVRGLVQNEGHRGAMRADLYQAGYSWDTGAHLSGNIGCHMTEVFNDNTMAHNCDTTRGDSGSPFMVREGNQYFVVGTDSNFRSNPGGPMIYIAVRSEAWLQYYDDFVAGRIGTGGTSAQPIGKPVK
ncbi:trypsin-like serine peptidase [Maricaulis sp.]|uniref:trypsin-like serine peptidase n=1 Tax=Maricaulis sp. TaxID=1486257 RepID=UPI003A90ACB6